MIAAYLDRFEGDKAVLYLGEAPEKVNFPRSLLPAGLNEGDYLTLEIKYDQAATAKALAEARELLR